MIDTTGLNSACIGVFGEALAFTIGTTTKNVTGVITRPRQPVATQSQSQNPVLPDVLGPDDLLIEMRTTDYAAASITRGATVSVDGRTYKVIKPWPDNGGMTKLELRA